MSPYYSHPGAVYDGIHSNGGTPTSSNHIILAGFTSSIGHSANNGTTTGNITYPNGSTGGDGGIATTPWFRCTPGKGGTKTNPTGGNGTGYGCGGGGGYGLADGGKGSGGYARISWNKYWNSENNEYDLANTGGGGGGASGNVVKYKISVRSGETIKYRIGKGGKGGYAISNANGGEFVSPVKGGDTIFAYGISRAVKAGGGEGGGHPALSEDNTAVVNGAGGKASKLCSAAGKDYYGAQCSTDIKTNCCTRGANGSGASNAQGGSGADLSGFGKGGGVRAAGTGTTDGMDAAKPGYGAGGGGASLRDMGILNNSETTSNPTRGGEGSNGAIILEWEE